MESSQKTKKNDFIELEFTGKVKDGEIFDTNVQEEAKKLDLKLSEKPMIICIGQGMVLKGLDSQLENREFGKKYIIELSKDQAFGSRRKELIRLIPKNIFTQQKISPKPGMALSLDNSLVRIASVSGGRVLVDFNNPLAGKEIIYEFKIKKLVSDINEKIRGILDFFFKNQKIDYEIKNKKVIFKIQEVYKPLIEELNKKFKDILGYELIIQENKESQEKSQKTNNSTSPQ
jgi:FKBP-type peptidyl-prolyl cis-trans isomerase SlyD